MVTPEVRCPNAANGDAMDRFCGGQRIRSCVVALPTRDDAHGMSPLGESKGHSSQHLARCRVVWVKISIDEDDLHHASKRGTCGCISSKLISRILQLRALRIPAT